MTKKGLEIDMDAVGDEDTTINAIHRWKYHSLWKCVSTPTIKKTQLMPTLETEGNEMPEGLALPPDERPGYYRRKRSIDMSLYHSLCVLPVKDH